MGWREVVDVPRGRLRINYWRELKRAAVIYPTLFAVTFACAVTACYVWPWLLDPIPLAPIGAR